MFDAELCLTTILQAIDERGTSAAAISMSATGSTDTIRNWTRKKQDGQLHSFHTSKLNQIEAELGIELISNGSNAKATNEREIKKLLSRIEGLPEAAITPIFHLINGYIRDAAQQEQSRDLAKPERATLHHAK